MLGVSASSSSPGVKRSPSDMTVVRMDVQRETPANLVDVVDRLVGDVPTREVRDPLPAVMMEAAVLDHLRRSHPGVPVQAGRYGPGTVFAQVAANLIGRCLGPCRSRRSAPRGASCMPSRTFGLERFCVPTWTIRRYLRAASTILRPSQIHQRGGLLHVYILACLAGPNRLQGVPVVLGGEVHRVDRLVVKQLPLLGVGLQFQARPARGSLGGPVEFALVAIADGGDFHVAAWAMAARLPMCECIRPPRPTMPTRIRSLAPCADRAIAGAARSEAAAAEDFRNSRRLELAMVVLLDLVTRSIYVSG